MLISLILFNTLILPLYICLAMPNMMYLAGQKMSKASWRDNWPTHIFVHSTILYPIPYSVVTIITVIDLIKGNSNLALFSQFFLFGYIVITFLPFFLCKDWDSSL